MYLRNEPLCIPVRKQPTIGFNPRVRSILSKIPEHPPLRRRAQHAVVGKMHPAEKINAGGKRSNAHFVGMQLDLQTVAQKYTYISAY